MVFRQSVAFVLIGLIDTSDDAPSQKEISHVLVRLFLRRDVKTIFDTFHTHAEKKSTR